MMIGTAFVCASAFSRGVVDDEHAAPRPVAP
jgi:hypothetical protein